MNILKLLVGVAFAVASLALVAPVKAETCNCGVTGICVCQPGKCQCPNCPGSTLRASHPGGDLDKFLRVHVVVPQKVVVPQRQSVAVVPQSQCRWVPGYGWDCSAGMTGKQKRIVKKAQRKGYSVVYE